VIDDLMNNLGAVDFHAMQPYAPIEVQTKVAGLFSVDNLWYRAEVLEIIPGLGEASAEYRLRYIDYGNTEVVTKDKIRVLPQEFQNIPPQARKAKLAYITAPAFDDDFGPESAELFKTLSWGKDLLANIQFVTTIKEKGSKIENEIHHITLGDEETKIFINAAMVINGFAHVDKRNKLPQKGIKWEMYNILQQEEQKARESRLNIWQYGDIASDDDEPKRFGKKNKK